MKFNLKIRNFRSAHVAHDQDHPGAQDGDVAVGLLEGGDGGLVGIGDRVESLARLYFVVDNSRRSCRLRFCVGR